MRRLGLQKRQDFRDPRFEFVIGRGNDVRRAVGCLPAVFQDGLRDEGRRRDEVDGAGLHRVSRHIRVSGVVGLLGDDEAALVLDRLQSETAVGARAREDDPDGFRAAGFRQRAQQNVER